MLTRGDAKRLDCTSQPYYNWLYVETLLTEYDLIINCAVLTFTHFKYSEARGIHYDLDWLGVKISLSLSSSSRLILKDIAQGYFSDGKTLLHFKKKLGIKHKETIVMF